jgi:hypothetical protein
MKPEARPFLSMLFLTDGEAAKTFYGNGFLKPNEHDFVVLLLKFSKEIKWDLKESKIFPLQKICCSNTIL